MPDGKTMASLEGGGELVFLGSGDASSLGRCRWQMVFRLLPGVEMASYWQPQASRSSQEHNPPASRDCLSGQGVQLLFHGRQPLFLGRGQLALGLQSAQLIQGLAEPGLGFGVLCCRPVHLPQFVKTDPQVQGGLGVVRVLVGQLLSSFRDFSKYSLAAFRSPNCILTSPSLL